MESTPLIRRIVTITGDAVQHHQNFKGIRTGMNYRELIEAAGGKKNQKSSFRRTYDGSGALYTGYQLQRASSSITAFVSVKLRIITEHLVSMRKCVGACPKLPLFSAYDGKDTYGMILRGLKVNVECVECVHMPMYVGKDPTRRV